VVRRHRLIEAFLVEVMQLDWTDVHEEAEVLEHVISDRLLDRIDEMLDHPTHDPHGAPIPDAQGNLPAPEGVPLSDCEAGQYQLLRVAEDDPGFLDWLAQQNSNPARSSG
jgi:DtxR family Mn-dependent transcriptional regulator